VTDATDTTAVPTADGERMRGPDALLWAIEHDPVLRSTILGIMVLEGTPAWDDLVARIDRLTRFVPRLRQRVEEHPLRAGPPRWVADTAFDLGYHLRRVRLPSEGDLATVLELAGPLVAAGFDRSRPVWEIVLVEGMAEGRSALLLKLHHSLTDGVGAIELALHLLDPPPDVAPAELPPAPTGDVLATASLWRRAIDDAASSSLRLVADVPGAISRIAAGAVEAVRDPATAVADARRTAASVARLLAPAGEPLSPLMRGRGLSRQLYAIEVPLADLRAAARAHGGTVNDAFLAAIGGGMARYHRDRGVHVEQLRVTMPINLRSSGDDPGGNRFSPARFPMPVDAGDPVRRMALAGEIARRWRDEPAMGFTDLLATAIDRLPVPMATSLFGAMLKGVDLVATNVPGVPFAVSLCGVPIEKQWAFAPPSGSALSIALLSHVGTACIGLNVDTVAVTEPDRLAAAIAEGFAEVAALGRADR